MSDAKRLSTMLESQIDLLEFEVKRLEEGGCRFGERVGNDHWQDRTEQAIHDKRNLIVTLSSVRALLAVPHF